VSVELSRRQRYRLTAITSAALTLLGGLVLIGPLAADYQAKLGDLEQARSALPPPSGLAQGLAPLTLRLQRLKQELAATRQSFPVAETVSTLLVQLERIATARVTVQEVYPTKLVPVNMPARRTHTDLAVSEQLMELVADGPYPALASFLSQLEDLPHPVGVHSIRLERTATPVLKPLGKTLAPLNDEDQLEMKVTLSAYLLDHPVKSVPLFNDAFRDQYERAQTTAGVVNPFTKLPATGLQHPSVAIPPPAVPALTLPPPPSQTESGRAHTRSPAWHLEGVLFGAEHTAIVSRKGEGSLTVQVGDDLEGWKVLRIEPRSVTLARGARQERLELPERDVGGR
jgi:hypothetical protein